MKTAHEILVASPISMPAVEIAGLLGVPVRFVYPELVSLEARGLARVVVRTRRNSTPTRTWAAGSKAHV